MTTHNQKAAFFILKTEMPTFKKPVAFFHFPTHQKSLMAIFRCNNSVNITSTDSTDNW